MSRSPHVRGERPHLLYVAWGFPPMIGGGTYRALASVNVFAEVGFDVTVLTASRNAFEHLNLETDPDLEARLDPRVTVHRVPFNEEFYEADQRKWSRERAADPLAWAEEWRAHQSDDFPEAPFGHWVTDLLAAADAVHRTRPVDVVVGTANPNVDLAVGDHLFHTQGVPYVIDHRDAWRLDCYTGQEKATVDPRVAELESRYMNNAAQVWFVNQPILDWHAQLYPEAAASMRVVPNGFDAWAPLSEPTVPAADAPLRFVFVGSIGVAVPVPEFVDGWVEGRSLPELAEASAHIHGPVTGIRSLMYRRLLDAAPGVHRHGPATRAELPQVYAEADVLLLILGGGEYVTSGKVYEYMATGLPIVSIHDPSSGAGAELADYPLWTSLTDLSPAAVAEGLARAAGQARHSTVEDRLQARVAVAGRERTSQLRPAALDLFARVSGQEGAR